MEEQTVNAVKNDTDKSTSARISFQYVKFYLFLFKGLLSVLLDGRFENKIKKKKGKFSLENSRQNNEL